MIHELKEIINQILNAVYSKITNGLCGQIQGFLDKVLDKSKSREVDPDEEDGDDAYPRILLTNSHDGMQAFKFSVGIFRLVCSNGLVVADEQFSDFKIKHKGYTFGELRNVVRQAVEDLPNRVQVMNDMKNRILTEDEKRKMALDAMLIRAGVKELKYDEETITDILDPKREADKGDDLWRVFNVIQEKVTQGDFHAALTGAKVRKVRKIKSFEKDMKVNKELFKLATALV